MHLTGVQLLWGGLTFLGYLLTLALIPSVFLNKKKHSATTAAWILTIVLIPYLGGLLYLVFGINRVARRAALRREARLKLGRNLPELSQYQLIPGESFASPVQALMRLASRVNPTRPTYGNRIEVLPETRRTYELIQEAIRGAQQSLHVEYYIWQPDETGTELRDLLIERAKAGVKVRFLYDSLGSMKLNRKFFAPMRDAGIQVASFLPGPTWRERWSINLRTHRKIIVADGLVGFTGGMNIGNEYLGLDKKFGYWRDTHLRMEGPTVLQLQQVFAEDWFFATGEALTQAELFPPPIGQGEQVAQVIAGGPDGEVDTFHSLYFAALNEARQRITLATSYFVPTPAMVTALESAAYRGVHVRLLLAGRSAHRYTVLAGRSFYDSLLAAGVEIYEYKGGLLHSKTITIDGNWSLVGSPNFDARSLLLNFEVGVALYDPRAATLLEEQFTADLENAGRIAADRWMKRPVSSVLIENVCRLFWPIL